MSNITVTDDNRSTYEQNKREMYDGMRAYHTSEQQHKRDAINFLKAVLTVAIAINGALLGSALSPEITISYFTELSWATTFITALVTFLIVNSVNKKIKADNAIYKIFGKEYTRLCCILELDKPVEVDGKLIEAKIIDPNNPIGQGDGYKKTMDIITKTGCAIVLIALALSLVNTFAI